MSKQLRVLVVDDSAFMRKVLINLLESDPGIRVVGTASDGQTAVTKAKELQPDVITLDIEMPVLDGFGALRQIMRAHPIPVVMVSSHTQDGAAATIAALAHGAVDFVAKPSGSVSLNMDGTRAELVRKVKEAARAQPRDIVAVDTRTFPLAGKPPVGARPEPKWLVVIGCSTGGPGALHAILPELPAALNAAILVVQHMPPGFTRSLARRLDELSAFRVKEAEPGDRLAAGVALIAPGGLHMVLDNVGAVALTADPPLHGVRPAVDRTLEAVIPRWGDRVVGVILTGMGFDGARGIRQLKHLGGRTIAQDQSTCVVYGMPRAVVDMGLADQVLPLHEIARAIVHLVAEG